MYKVLLVDDEILILKGLEKRIEWAKLGFEICGMFQDTITTLEYLKNNTVDLIIVDMRIPEVSGIELMRTVLKTHKCLFIVLSGYADFKYAQDALKLGAQDYLVKPVSNYILTQSLLEAKKVLSKKSSENSIENHLRAMFDIKPDEISEMFNLPETHSLYYCVACCKPEVIKAFNVIDSTKVICIKIFEQRKISMFLLCSNTDTDSVMSELNHIDKNSYYISQSFADLSFLYSCASTAYLILHANFLLKTNMLDDYCDDLTIPSNFVSGLKSAHEKKDYDAMLDIVLGMDKLFAINNCSMSCFEYLYNATIEILNSAHNDHYTKQIILEKYDNIISVKNYFIKLINAAYVLENSNIQISNKHALLLVKDYIDNNYNQEFTLQQIADKYFINMSYLSTLFKAEFKESFAAYVTKVRINHACIMLKTLTLSSEKISKICGYNDYSYFNKVFKKNIGITPGEYRNTNVIKQQK